MACSQTPAPKQEMPERFGSLRVPALEKMPSRGEKP